MPVLVAEPDPDPTPLLGLLGEAGARLEGLRLLSGRLVLKAELGDEALQILVLSGRVAVTTAPTMRSAVVLVTDVSAATCETRSALFICSPPSTAVGFATMVRTAIGVPSARTRCNPCTAWSRDERGRPGAVARVRVVWSVT